MKTCRECITEVACEKAGRCFNGSSAIPPPEIAGQVSSLGLATGSLPVSSAEALAKEWEWHAKLSSLRIVQTTLRGCANDLRQLAGLAESRQPQENGAYQPRPSNTGNLSK